MAATTTTPTTSKAKTTTATKKQAQIDARISTLTNLSGHATFIIGGKVLDMKKARGISGTFTPTTKQTTKDQWSKRLKDLTPKETKNIDSLIDTYEDPPKAKKIEALAKKPMTFSEWADERSKMTEDEIFAIEAETQGLKELTPAQLQLEKERGVRTFAEWVDARKDLTEDEIFDIEAETQGLKKLTPAEIRALEARNLAEREPEEPLTKAQQQIEKEKNVKTFAEWVDARKDLTEDEIFDIEAEVHGLKPLTKAQQQLLKEQDIKIFAEWVDARKDLTEDEIFDIEAEVHGLKELPPEKITELEARDRAEMEAPEKYTREESKVLDQFEIPEAEQDMFVKMYRQQKEEINKLEGRSDDEKGQLLSEYAADIAELTQGEEEGTEELQRLEEEEKRLTPELETEEAAAMRAATEEGERLTPELEAEEAAAMKAAGKIPTPTVKPELIIERTPYPKWWKDAGVAAIEITAPGSQTVIKGSTKGRLFIACIIITVTEETVITIAFGNGGSSGPIYLGGTDQPKAFVAAMGNSPAPCGKGSLKITATDPGGANPEVGGFTTYFMEGE